MNLITVPFSPIIRQRLARISEKSGLSPATLIRHAVKKQLPLWDGDGGESEGARVRRKMKFGKISGLKRTL